MGEAPGLPREYFDQLYRESADPWSFESRWYERRKRAMSMAVLPRPRYASVLELGCSTGLLTAELAARADLVTATDISQGAIELARSSLHDRSNVRLLRADVRAGLPDGPFDLIVVSEVAYYLSRDELGGLGAAVVGALAEDADVLLCHWRHPVADYPLGGDEAQHMLVDALGLHRLSRLEEKDLILEVLSTDATSVGAREGLE